MRSGADYTCSRAARAAIDGTVGGCANVVPFKTGSSDGLPSNCRLVKFQGFSQDRILQFVLSMMSKIQWSVEGWKCERCGSRFSGTLQFSQEVWEGSAEALPWRFSFPFVGVSFWVPHSLSD